MWRTRLLLLLIFILFLSPTVSAQVRWVQHVNPTSDAEFGYGTCLFGDYVAVVGRVGGFPFLALLDRESGEVVNATWIKEFGWFFNCVAVGERLYVAGYYHVYVFDRGLNLLHRFQTRNTAPRDVVYQGGYFYIGGYGWRDFGGYYRGLWYIEKRASDLGLVASREIFEEYWVYSVVFNIGVNPATGDVWAVGYHTLGGLSRPLVAILDQDLNVKRLVRFPGQVGYFGSMCFDGGGNAYVSGIVEGEEVTVKFDKDGDEVKRYNGGGVVACVKDRLYLFRRVKEGSAWRLVYEVIDAKTMESIRRVYLPASSEFNLTNFYAPGKPSFDGRYIYVAGVLELRRGNGTRPISDTEVVVFAVPVVSTVRVVDSSGRPLAGFVVRAVAGNCSLVNSTGADGVASFWGLAPDVVYVYDGGGRLVWHGSVASLDATVTVRLANSFSATGPADLRDYLAMSLTAAAVAVAVIGLVVVRLRSRGKGH